MRIAIKKHMTQLTENAKKPIYVNGRTYQLELIFNKMADTRLNSILNLNKVNHNVD